MRLFTFLTLIALVVFSTFGKTDSTANLKNIETYTNLTEKLEKAVEQRNFARARLALEEILPIMKEDIKESKKTLHHLQKEENPEVSAKDFEASYDRKVEIYDNLKHLIDLSPAALRVKSEMIVTNVSEYGKLMKGEPTE